MATKAGGRRWRPALARLLLVVVIVILWEKASPWFGIPNFLIPPPSSLARLLIEERAEFLRHTQITVAAAAVGFLVGNGVAVLLASLFLYSRTFERIILPLALAVRSVPLVALTPLFLLWLGNGFATKVTIVAIISFFPMLVNFGQGLRSANRAALEMMHTLAANGWQVLWKIRLPSALPLTFAALRITATSAILGAVIAEFIASTSGLGFIIGQAFSTFEFEELWTAMGISTVLAVLLFFGVAFLERRLIPWHETVSRLHHRVGER